jgi:heat shock protein HtpX
MNLFKTTFLLTVLTLLLVWIGDALAGPQGAWLFLVIAGVMNFFAFWFSDKMVLAMYRAKPVAEAQAPQLYAVVRRLSERSGIPMPRLYLIPSESPNAFATGRSPQHAVVAVTEGILRLLSSDELEGVLAHELGHVRNRDTLIMVIAATLGGAISMIANIAQWGMIFGGGRSDDERGNPLAALVGIIVAPLAAMLIQMAISRSREFGADEAGAKLSGDPLALASALRKIEAYSQRVPMQHGGPATAHLFIINPFTAGGLANLFRTHPPTDARVERLEAMARGAL